MIRAPKSGLLLLILTVHNEVNIFDKNNNLCLYANLTVDFSVAYKGTDNKTANFELPANATTKGSLCEKSSLLKLNFENGHSWSMNLTTDEKSYQANTITFSYNLNDTKLFPNASSQVNPDIKDVGIGTSYSCMSKDTIQSDTVNQTLWNVLIQAFVENNSTSKNGEFTSCIADLSTTTVAPTTHGTNSTTAAPVTNTTSIAPPTTTAPAPTLPAPTTGKYRINSSDTGAGCLLANFGLRIGLWRKYQEMNLEPNKTTASGSCKANSSELVLVSDSMTITLTFTNVTCLFLLQGVFSEANTSLSLWEASLGSSYLCNKEQNYTITGLLTLFTFDLHVQPFGVNKNVFSTAHECSMDDINILIPIIVGAALAGLIVIVVIAYVIGRRKTHVGYQTL
uniref:Uncharacterized protein n=1 Tax=Mola mola TaxID=94237 RepID=A0A3Q3VUR7_MOLML